MKTSAPVTLGDQVAFPSGIQGITNSGTVIGIEGDNLAVRLDCAIQTVPAADAFKIVPAPMERASIGDVPPAPFAPQVVAEAAPATEAAPAAPVEPAAVNPTSENAPAF